MTKDRAEERALMGAEVLKFAICTKANKLMIE